MKTQFDFLLEELIVIDKNYRNDILPIKISIPDLIKMMRAAKEQHEAYLLNGSINDLTKNKNIEIIIDEKTGELKWKKK